MRKSDLYTITLDPLIESYLDIFEVYQYKYMLWKEKGFPETQKQQTRLELLTIASIH